MDGQQTDSGFDSSGFRQALGAFVTGVTIVTTCDEAGVPAGLTANSFNSVSLSPPMVLWSLSLDSASLGAFRSAPYWAVHVLAAGQEALSAQFAGREGDKFAGVRTVEGPGGIPLLDDYAARFVCRAAFEYEGGDHAIFLGRVESFSRTGKTPLVYHQGRYGGVFPGSPGGAQARSLAALEARGLIERNGGEVRLSADGRAVADAFVALADLGLSQHEAAALRHLMPRLG